MACRLAGPFPRSLARRAEAHGPGIRIDACHVRGVSHPREASAANGAGVRRGAPRALGLRNARRHRHGRRADPAHRARRDARRRRRRRAIRAGRRSQVERPYERARPLRPRAGRRGALSQPVGPRPFLPARRRPSGRSDETRHVALAQRRRALDERRRLPHGRARPLVPRHRRDRDGARGGRAGAAALASADRERSRGRGG